MSSLLRLLSQRRSSRSSLLGHKIMVPTRTEHVKIYLCSSKNWSDIVKCVTPSCRAICLKLSYSFPFLFHLNLPPPPQKKIIFLNWAFCSFNFQFLIYGHFLVAFMCSCLLLCFQLSVAFWDENHWTSCNSLILCSLYVVVRSHTFSLKDQEPRIKCAITSCRIKIYLFIYMLK